MGWALKHKRGKSAAPLVDHVILAEFDIDSGSTVRHKYPRPVPGYTDDYFAEYMLPEGAHNHSLDWCVFFLNKRKPALDADFPPLLPREQDAAAGVGQVRTPPPLPPRPTSSDDLSEEERARTGPFLYCINLVRKKDDPTVRRGAVVKALTVCSQYNFIEVFRPLLLIALDRYYTLQDPVVLKDLFDTLNGADLSEVPRPCPWERQLMRRGLADRYVGSCPDEHLPHKWTHTISFGKQGAEGQPVQASIPLHTSPDETLGPSIMLLLNVFGQAKAVNARTHRAVERRRRDCLSAMKIYNAVLTGQRVLFVGYNHASGDVCKLVLAALALMSPPIQGLVHRTFPYANLSDLSFLEVEGFIAGVTNPMFESHHEWWDILCALDLPNGTGTVVTAEEKAALDQAKGRSSPPPTPGGPRVSAEQLMTEEDARFVNGLIATMKSPHINEQLARTKFLDYTAALFDLATDQVTGLCYKLSETARAEHEYKCERNAWRLGKLIKLYHVTAETDGNPWDRCSARLKIPGSRLREHLRRLQLERDMHTPDARHIFQELTDALQSEESLQVLLGLLPESQGGISVLAQGLMHSDESIRANSVRLLARMDSFDSTRPAVTCMSDFFAFRFFHALSTIKADAAAATASAQAEQVVAGQPAAH